MSTRRWHGLGIASLVLLLSICQANGSFHSQDFMREVVAGSSTLFCDANNVATNYDPSHRRLTANISSFRSVVGFGFRGRSNAAIVPVLSDESCATLCVQDSLCLSFDVEANMCYIAHTDRYAFPQDFLPRSGSTYFEWQVMAASPSFEPNGGVFHTQTSIRIFTQTRAAAMYYQIISTNGSVVVDYTLATPDLAIVLPEFPCQVLAYSTKVGLDKSPVTTSNLYDIRASKYMYLVPYYNGADFHGKLTRVKLDVQGKKRPRPSLVLEFTDLETFFGIGPFQDQVQVLNLTALDPRMAGYYDGFSVVSTTSYVNVSLESYDDLSQWTLIDSATYRENPGNTIFNNNVPITEEHLYLSPYMNGGGYSGLVTKVYLRAFDASTLPPFSPPVYSILDLTQLDPDLTGFVSCFTRNNFGYFVQRNNDNGLGGKVVRVDLSEFHNAPRLAATVLDLEQIDGRLVGFGGAFVYGKYAFLTPLDRNRVGLELNPNYKYFPTPTSSCMARVDLDDFATVQVVDFSHLNPKFARGYFGGFTVNSFAYFVPYMWTANDLSPTVNPYHGVIIRLNLLTLAIEKLDLTLVDPSLKGFMRGFAFGKYAVFVPHKNGPHNITPRRVNPSQKLHFGKLVRVNTDVFSPDGVDVLDLTATLRSQIPNLPDVELRGFLGGGASGQYGFFVPYFNGVRFAGKVVRVNLRTFNEVQVLDMTQIDDTLRGFTGAVMSATPEPTDTSLWQWTIPEGTRAMYTFIHEENA
ncbi:hypothetical protein, variant 1 [Aphanomyces astaci]|uniref:Apple domain-containing protein n=1 Tax=Aphanomyces astaci TaxID=112090 RepID=W4GZ73_APHAT|nr:hypothetical protein, variant 1 [Aphanomyces astaci]ETV84314.1 hypothetical protein, variant 1 [Aphanomyces astaci]|eukprot:XP_009826006.1 hypothetical protein, variant 1 [Aphanomyces astaci]